MFEHFVTAQNAVWPDVVAELRAGRKASHWMWFVFPQLRGLGHSERAQRYGLAGLAEAQDYLAHPVLGPRLRECTGLVLASEGRTAAELFGPVDALKFRSSMTLFKHAAPEESRWRDALARFYGGEEDPLTLRLLAGAASRA
ncbi:MAG TPA: DUF1810 domain-containing protein [Alphaproteobacteria bacterium]|nr:DUF1810 domain-containing protein [Alphaproteobacteria bacterium]